MARSWRTITHKADERLVELYRSYLNAPSAKLKAYWHGRIEEHAAQNAHTQADLNAAKRTAKQS